MTNKSNAQAQATVQDVIARGFRALSQGNLDEARGCCMAILKQHPNNEQTHFLVGLIGLASNDREKAALAFQFRYQPQPRPCGRMGAPWQSYRRKVGKLTGPTTPSDMAVKHESGDIAEVQDVIGSTYALLGEHETANQWFKKAAAKAPNNLSVGVNLSQQPDIPW